MKNKNKRIIEVNGVKTLMKNRILSIGIICVCALLITILFLCITKRYPKESDKETIELVMATYKKAWIDGANASTKSQNKTGCFNDSIGNLMFKKDSLAFKTTIDVFLCGN
jgi:hypothetical protein